MTSNLSIQGDLGLWTIQGQMDFQRLCYWFHILSLSETRILKQSYLMSKSFTNEKKTNWANTTKKIIMKYSKVEIKSQKNPQILCKLTDIWEKPELVYNIDSKGNGEAKNIEAHKRFFKKYLFKIIQQREEDSWKKKMWKDNPNPNKKNKLRTYRLFKTNLRLEKYLLVSTNYRGRAFMFNLRSGTNRLAIERGRWENKKEEERVCGHCDLMHVENEYHFVVVCPKYEPLRKILFQKTFEISQHKWNLDGLGLHTQFLLLINGTGDTYEVQTFKLFQSFLSRAFKLRGE
jgi:hypothetical protein